jgi:hypothetical protein
MIVKNRATELITLHLKLFDSANKRERERER